MIALFPIHWMWVEFDKLELIDSDPALNGTLSLNECTVSQEQGASDQMKELLPKGGVVGKLWIGKADKYHLLRLDPQPGANSFPAARLISSFAATTISRSAFDFWARGRQGRMKLRAMEAL
jgi:hypothetical protein